MEYLISVSTTSRSLIVQITNKLLNKKSYTDHWKWKFLFASLQILTGPNDWKDYSTGKEGAERYRTQNLPNNNCPGDYELGVLAPSPFIRKVDPSLVIPAYLGQTDDVRSRLQSYGRDGAHLEKALFFSDIFSMNFSIVYRWVPVSTN